MKSCPIDFYKDNLIFNEDKTCWAVFRMTGYDYDYLSHSHKMDTLFNVSQVLADTMSRMQILIVPVGQTTKEAMEKLRNGLDKDNILYDKANEVIDFTAERLRKKFTMEKSNDYKTYLIVRLNLKDELEVISQVKDAAEFFIKEPKNAIDVFLRLWGRTTDSKCSTC